MAQKHIVCHGAVCMCNFGASPDKLVVKSHKKEFINDSEGTKKLIASDKDLGATFEKNTFGPCQKQPSGAGNKPCQAIVSKWSSFYEHVTLENEGKVLLEDSKGTCPIGGPDCIKITFHGQVSAPTAQNAQAAKPEVMSVLNPMVEMDDFNEEDETPNYT